MTKEKLEAKLNEEYKYIGKITIEELARIEVGISDLEYVDSIMGEIDGLDRDDPIVVSEAHDFWSGKKKYTIVDGYHRVKNKIEKGEKTIEAFLLVDFKLKRSTDNLFSFFEKCVGKTICFKSDHILLLDGKYYRIEANEGCGGCNSGWSSISILKQYLGKAMKIKKVESDEKENDDEYKLIINGKHVADVDTGWGSGYYGGDFEVHLIAQ